MGSGGIFRASKLLSMGSTMVTVDIGSSFLRFMLIMPVATRQVRSHTSRLAAKMGLGYIPLIYTASTACRTFLRACSIRSPMGV